MVTYNRFKKIWSEGFTKVKEIIDTEFISVVFGSTLNTDHLRDIARTNCWWFMKKMKSTRSEMTSKQLEAIESAIDLLIEGSDGSRRKVYNLMRLAMHD
jgi:hypothetical protein